MSSPAPGSGPGRDNKRNWGVLFLILGMLLLAGFYSALMGPLDNPKVVIISLLVGLVILAALVVVACIISLVRAPREVPIVISPESARRHIALICLIRAGEGLIVVPILLMGLLIGFGFFVSLNPFQDTPAHSTVFSLIMLAAILMVSTIIIGKSLHRFPKSGRDIFPGLMRVTTNSISNFAFIFAALAAHDFYQLRPPQSHLIHGADGQMQFWLGRDNMWILIFWVLWRGVKDILCRILELTPPAPAQDQPPDDPDVPEFPQKSPLVQM